MATYLGASCTKTKIAKADTRAVSVAKIPTTTRIIVTSLLVWCIGSHGWVQLSKPPKFQSGYNDLEYTLVQTAVAHWKLVIKKCYWWGSNLGPFTYRCSTGHCISRCIRSPPVSSMFQRSVPGGSSSVCIWIGIHGWSESFLGNLSHENSSGSSIPNDSISDAHSVMTFLGFSHASFSIFFHIFTIFFWKLQVCKTFPIWQSDWHGGTGMSYGSVPERSSLTQAGDRTEHKNKSR